MNIQQAIEQVETAVRAYTARDETGLPLIPPASQRPLYLVGPPGIGKTAILGQIAGRLGIGLASYTMTHHTRQSALGLPVLKDAVFDGREVTVTEYTMSEIVAELYRREEDAGILFLDEINCVSETLMPAMLELLQHKRFGTHALPEGWVIVCAGNPEKYNRAARPLDPVAMDRVRTIRIEPDLNAWLPYAESAGVHPAIRAYLKLRPGDFYRAEGDAIVTPRSWTDLSEMMRALESAGRVPDGLLFEQYLQAPEVAEGFSLYFALCRKVSEEFQLDALIDAPEGEFDRAFQGASFDERLFAKLLLDDCRRGREAEKARAERLKTRVSYFIDGVDREASGGTDRAKIAREHVSRMENALAVKKNSGLLSAEQEREELALLRAIRALGW